MLVVNQQDTHAEQKQQQVIPAGSKPQTRISTPEQQGDLQHIRKQATEASAIVRQRNGNLKHLRQGRDSQEKETVGADEAGPEQCPRTPRLEQGQRHTPQKGRLEALSHSKSRSSSSDASDKQAVQEKMEPKSRSGTQQDRQQPDRKQQPDRQHSASNRRDKQQGQPQQRQERGTDVKMTSRTDPPRGSATRGGSSNDGRAGEAGSDKPNGGSSSRPSSSRAAGPSGSRPAGSGNGGSSRDHPAQRSSQPSGRGSSPPRDRRANRDSRHAWDGRNARDARDSKEQPSRVRERPRSPGPAAGGSREPRDSRKDSGSRDRRDRGPGRSREPDLERGGGREQPNSRAARFVEVPPELDRTRRGRDRSAERKADRSADRGREKSGSGTSDRPPAPAAPAAPAPAAPAPAAGDAAPHNPPSNPFELVEKFFAKQEVLQELLLPTPTNVSIIHIPGSDLVNFIAVQQWVQDNLGLSLQLLAGTFVSVLSADIPEVCPKDIMPASAAQTGESSSNNGFARAVAENIPWRLRQIESMELPPRGAPAEEAELVLVGGGRIKASTVGQGFLSELADCEYLCCELATLQMEGKLQRLRLYDLAHICWRLRLLDELETAINLCQQEQESLQAAGFDSEMLQAAAANAHGSMRDNIKKLPPLTFVNDKLMAYLEVNPIARPEYPEEKKSPLGLEQVVALISCASDAWKYYVVEKLAGRKPVPVTDFVPWAPPSLGGADPQLDEQAAAAAAVDVAAAGVAPMDPGMAAGYDGGGGVIQQEQQQQHGPASGSGYQQMPPGQDSGFPALPDQQQQGQQQFMPVYQQQQDQQMFEEPMYRQNHMQQDMAGLLSPFGAQQQQQQQPASMGGFGGLAAAARAMNLPNGIGSMPTAVQAVTSGMPAPSALPPPRGGTMLHMNAAAVPHAAAAVLMDMDDGDDHGFFDDPLQPAGTSSLQPLGGPGAGQFGSLGGGLGQPQGILSLGMAAAEPGAANGPLQGAGVSLNVGSGSGIPGLQSSSRYGGDRGALAGTASAPTASAPTAPGLQALLSKYDGAAGGDNGLGAGNGSNAAAGQPPNSGSADYMYWVERGDETAAATDPRRYGRGRGAAHKHALPGPGGPLWGGLAPPPGMGDAQGAAAAATAATSAARSDAGGYSAMGMLQEQLQKQRQDHQQRQSLQERLGGGGRTATAAPAAAGGGGGAAGSSRVSVMDRLGPVRTGTAAAAPAGDLEGGRGSRARGDREHDNDAAAGLRSAAGRRARSSSRDGRRHHSPQRGRQGASPGAGRRGPSPSPRANRGSSPAGRHGRHKASDSPVRYRPGYGPGARGSSRSPRRRSSRSRSPARGRSPARDTRDSRPGRRHHSSSPSAGKRRRSGSRDAAGKQISSRVGGNNSPDRSKRGRRDDPGAAAGSLLPPRGQQQQQADEQARGRAAVARVADATQDANRAPAAAAAAAGSPAPNLESVQQRFSGRLEGAQNIFADLRIENEVRAWLRRLAEMAGPPPRSLEQPTTFKLTTLAKQHPVPQEVLKAYGSMSAFVKERPELASSGDGKRSIHIVKAYHTDLLAVGRESAEADTQEGKAKGAATAAAAAGAAAAGGDDAARLTGDKQQHREDAEKRRAGEEGKGRGREGGKEEGRDRDKEKSSSRWADSRQEGRQEGGGSSSRQHARDKERSPDGRAAAARERDEAGKSRRRPEPLWTEDRHAYDGRSGGSAGAGAGAAASPSRASTRSGDRSVPVSPSPTAGGRVGRAPRSPVPPPARPGSAQGRHGGSGGPVGRGGSRGPMLEPLPPHVLDAAIHEFIDNLLHKMRSYPGGLLPIEVAYSMLPPPLADRVYPAGNVDLQKFIADFLPRFEVVPDRGRLVVGHVPPDTFIRPPPKACAFWKPETLDGCTMGARCDFRHTLVGGLRF